MQSTAVLNGNYRSCLFARKYPLRTALLAIHRWAWPFPVAASSRPFRPLVVGKFYHQIAMVTSSDNHGNTLHVGYMGTKPAQALLHGSGLVFGPDAAVRALGENVGSGSMRAWYERARAPRAALDAVQRDCRGDSESNDVTTHRRHSHAIARRRGMAGEAGGDSGVDGCWPL